MSFWLELLECYMTVAYIPSDKSPRDIHRRFALKEKLSSPFPIVNGALEYFRCVLVVVSVVRYHRCGFSTFPIDALGPPAPQNSARLPAGGGRMDLRMVRCLRDEVGAPDALQGT